MVFFFRLLLFVIFTLQATPFKKDKFLPIIAIVCMKNGSFSCNIAISTPAFCRKLIVLLIIIIINCSDTS